MELLPIDQTLEENNDFAMNPDCQDSLQMCIDFYKRVGFNPPWIGYFKMDNQIVGSAAFKGRPVDGQVEIAYGTIERFRHQGIGKVICKLLVELSLSTYHSVIITARTFDKRNFSTQILETNKFKLVGTVNDPEDGEVWEWRYYA